jgi:hypothetical protein
MKLPPAVIVHSLPDARLALGPGHPVTLLSAPGAALYAGSLWWRSLMDLARAEYPGAEAPDLLDCAGAAGRALEALRAGQRAIVLNRTCPAFTSVANRAREMGVLVLDTAPPALDLATLRRGGGKTAESTKQTLWKWLISATGAS